MSIIKRFSGLAGNVAENVFGAVLGNVISGVAQTNGDNESKDQKKGLGGPKALVAKAASSTTDEILTTQAFYLAQEMYKVPIKKIQMIQRAINSLRLDQRKKVVNTIGHSTQEKMTHSADSKKVSSEQLNIMGAELITILAQLENEEEVRKFMDACGMTTTIMDEISDAFGQVRSIAKRFGILNKVKNFDQASFGQNSKAGKVTRDMRQKARARFDRSRHK